MKTGLVLEGGGMRGGYTAGVLDAFIDHGITFSSCIGVSAGACNAVSYIAGQRKRYFYANTRYLRDKRYMGLYSLLKTGYLFGNRFVFDDITFELEPLDFEGFQQGAKSCPFTVVTTDCKTGRARYDVIKDLRREMQLVEASSSLPLISPMIPYEDTLLADGGISDSIPIQRAFQDGCDRVVAVLTQDKSYRKSPNRLLPLIRLRYRHYPALVEALEKRHTEYNRTLDWIEKEKESGRLLVIQPEQPVSIGRMERNPEKITALYEEGLRQGERLSGQVQAFLKGR